MPQEAHMIEATESPLQLLGGAAHWLAGAVIVCAVAAVLGVRAARAMRRRRLHHRCAGAALLAVVMVHGLLGAQVSLALAMGAVSALRHGRRWHREDLQAGEDLAASACERRGPLALAGEQLARLRLERSGARELPAACAAGAIVLGRDERWRGVRIPLGGTRGGSHTLVVGATGSGKTVTQSRIAVGAVERGMGAVVLDPKGDAGMREALLAAASQAGRPFIAWTPEGRSVYNPFAVGSETEIADKALAGERFTEPHYLRQAQRYLAHAVRALRAAEQHEVSLRRHRGMSRAGAP